MLDQLTERFDNIFKRLRGQARLSDKNIQEAVRLIRRALLEADVHYDVVKHFLAEVQAKAQGQEVLRSITPGQQFIKIVHRELVRLLGEENVPLQLAGSPAVILLVGLQGSGKTTTAAKLARLLKRKGRSPLLVAADIYRPAAVEQLKVLGQQSSIPVYCGAEGTQPEEIVSQALKEARRIPADVAIVDTAGRLHVDEQMMAEIRRLKKRFQPSEILFVADAMTGQDAVTAARAFMEAVDFTGVVLTKLDGDARGGAALSIRYLTGQPIKFIGVGEKLEALDPFHPQRLADRILGMGDVVTLVEKAQQEIDLEKAQRWEEKLRKNRFDLEDFRDQLRQIRRLGPLKELLGMLPGGAKLQQMPVDERRLVRIEAIINSMTPLERQRPEIIKGSRRRRIAAGSGTTVQEVNQLLKQFRSMQKMLARFRKMPQSRLLRGFPMNF